ncbi:unnamed protein product [Miscanthus lutarioriparius]|uniref:Transcription factor CBF/NF-Y/archaeal histone domain-containing protein n=1 Tax=Miscanthus lutarioriparius TaxID=422564 RepID=A0A811RU79_9POAL|nr:unnamed protein product [Miscanthus lutarioriparius]
MRKKLDTRFPAPRIKKIMQADEDVGKIALAVPVLVFFLLNVFRKQCIQTYNVYDFLTEVVSKVPDIGPSDVIADDKLGKRRKAEEDGSEEELKRTRNEAESYTSNGRGRGRGRRGCGAWREVFTTHEQFAENQSSKLASLKVEVADEVPNATEAKAATTPVSNARASLRNIDLNLDPTAEEDEVTVPPQAQLPAPATSSVAATAGPGPSAGPSVPRSKEGAKLKDFLGAWELPDMNKMEMDPIQFALSTNHRLEEDEDYDNEN